MVPFNIRWLFIVNIDIIVANIFAVFCFLGDWACESNSLTDMNIYSNDHKKENGALIKSLIGMWIANLS